jgi:hypothetical protein
MAVEDATDAQIVAALERLVVCEGAATFVVLNGDRYRNYYLQFAAVDGKIHCEAVANAFLNQLTNSTTNTPPSSRTSDGTPQLTAS